MVRRGAQAPARREGRSVLIDPRPWYRSIKSRTTAACARATLAGTGGERTSEARDLQDRDRRRQPLRLRVGRPVGGGRRLLDLADDVHALDDAAKRGEALAVGIALAAEVARAWSTSTTKSPSSVWTSTRTMAARSVWPAAIEAADANTSVEITHRMAKCRVRIMSPLEWRKPCVEHDRPIAKGHEGSTLRALRAIGSGLRTCRSPRTGTAWRAGRTRRRRAVRSADCRRD